MKAKLFSAVSCVALAALTSCHTNQDVLDRSQRFADRHKFYQAYWVVEQARNEAPDDPELERVYWERRLDYLLDRGEQLVFAEQELKAIAEFRKALALDPENERAKTWIHRAHQKLAMAALSRADSMRFEGDLPGSLKLYNQAAAYIEELPDAMKGIAEVNRLYEKRSEAANEHYVQGSRARGEQKFRQSHYHGKVAVGLDKSSKRAKKLVTDAGRRLAQDILDQAKASEEKGFYAAALQKYLKVKDQVPETPGLDARIKAMQTEVKVRQMCRDAQMLTRKKEFDKADKMLREAFEKSATEKAYVSGLMLAAKERRFDQAYLLAKDLAFEQQFEKALEAFREIKKAYPKSDFRDVAQRISELDSQITSAKKSFDLGAKAEKAQKWKEALNHYKDAVLVYPGYRKLDSKINELKARVDTKPGK